MGTGTLRSISTSNSGWLVPGATEGIDMGPPELVANYDTGRRSTAPARATDASPCPRALTRTCCGCPRSLLAQLRPPPTGPVGPSQHSGVGGDHDILAVPASQ